MASSDALLACQEAVQKAFPSLDADLSQYVNGE